jgi:hypothetical protein
MELIEKDEALFDLLKDVTVRILDAEIVRINIFTESIGTLCIEIDFKYRDQNLRLKFSGIKEYSFYHNDTYLLRYVECFKLIKVDGFFYLSLDPEDEFSQSPNDNDQDLILCKSIEGYYVDIN